MWRDALWGGALTSHVAAKSHTVAAFDFDGTLIRGDSMWYVLHGGLGSKRWCWVLLLSSPWIVMYLFGLCSNEKAKSKLLYHALAHRPLTEVEQWGHQFVQTKMPHLFHPPTLERLAWHKARGHACLLVSASVDLYMVQVGRALGMDDVLCTPMEVAGLLVTGHMGGPNCHGPEKVRRIQRWLDAKSWARSTVELYAYGDSSGDAAMLDMADHAFMRGKAWRN